VTLKSVLIRITLELWGFALVSAASLFEIGRALLGDWRNIFLFNGDSIVLPLFNQSLHSGEPSAWVFSSQTFFFPEFPIYWLVSILFPAVAVSLVANALVNLLLLYVLFRIIVGFSRARAAIQIALAIASTVVFIVYSLTERLAFIIPPGLVHPSSIATLYLVTTYYYGVIVVGLAVVALTLWLTRSFSFAPSTLRRTLLFIGVVGALTAISTYSDPLFLLQFEIPAGGALLILHLARRVTLRWFLIIELPQIVGTALGFAFRAVFARYIGGSIASYFGFSQSGQAATVLRVVVGIWASNPFGRVKLSLLVVMIAIPIIYLARAAVRSRRGRLPGSDPFALFIMAFILISVVTLICGQIVTGQNFTRYLEPLFIFPELAILLLARQEGLATALDRWSIRHRSGALRLIAIFALLSIGTSVALSSLSVSRVMAAVRNPEAPGQVCLDNWLGKSDANGVGSFMITRALKLYGDQNGQLLQVYMAPNMKVWAWMNNLASYHDRTFSYLLVDPYDITRKDALATAGDPTSITNCGVFKIYDYAGASGETSLNHAIASSLAPLLAEYDR
jgi:hypothetical protein